MLRDLVAIDACLYRLELGGQRGLALVGEQQLLEKRLDPADEFVVTIDLLEQDDRERGDEPAFLRLEQVFAALLKLHLQRKALLRIDQAKDGLLGLLL